MHVVTLAIIMIVAGVETKMSDVTVTSVDSDKCCDYDCFCDFDEWCDCDEWCDSDKCCD